MAGLSDSFTKLVLKIGENVATRKNDFTTPPSTPITAHSTRERPGSPFIMVEEGEEEEVEFEYKQTDRSHDSISGEFLSPNENYFSPKVVNQNEGSLNQNLFEIYGEEEIYETESEDDEAAMHEIDESRSHRSNPVTKEQFEACFDECGRLIHEHELRKQIFKGGVDDDIRKNVWKFLFELYPCNSTAREREVLQVENIVRYEAMKIRWKDILQNLDIDHEYEGVRYCPKWYGACPYTNKNLLHSPNCDPIIKSPSRTSLEDSGNAEDISNNKDEEDEDADISINSIENESHSPPPQDVKPKNVNDISKALADAMLESNLCDKDRLNVSLTEPLCVDIQSPRLFSEEILVDNSDIEDIPEIPEDELFDNKVFPNPFMMSPEYVNMKESLYSMSENIASVDFELMSSETALEGDIPASNLKSNIENCLLNTSCQQVDELSNKINETSKGPCLNEISDNIEILDRMPAYIHSQCNGKDNQDFHHHFQSTTTEIDTTTTALVNGIHTKPNTPTTEFDENSSSEIAAIIETVNTTTTPDTTTSNTTATTEVDGNISSVETTFDNDKYDETDIPVFQLDDIEDADDESQQQNTNSGPDNEDSGNDEKRTDLLSINFENNHSRESLNGIESCPHVQSRKTSAASTVNDDQVETRYIAKSPTGETLDKLPPWIAQMIRVSTPTSPREKKEIQLTDIEFEECLCQKTRDELELKKEQIELNKELLGIVENANKFVKENMKSHSGRSTPKELMQNATSESPEDNVADTPSKPKDLALTQTPASKHINEINESSFLSPISNSEASVFIQRTPSLKLVAEENGSNDQTDGTEKLKLPDSGEKKCPYCSFEAETSTKIVLPLSLGDEQLKFMEIQAQVFAARQPYSKKRVTESVRVIDKDIPRTDRELEMFSSCEGPGLLMLRDALLTFAFFHPEVGYAQGMNDIMARFLYVMKDEADAYWMFSQYMEHFKNDFMEEGMLVKIAQVEQLLMKMDRELYDFLQSTDMGLIFCHRWLLLNFKREFEYNEAVRLFEITSSRHLEVSSLSAIIERSKKRAKEFVKDSAGSHMEEVFLLPEYPFDIFLCVAMLMECREMIMGDDDITMVYQILSNLPKTLDLQSILRKSEELFYRYCRKTTVDCFQVIDDVYEVPTAQNKRISFPFNFR